MTSWPVLSLTTFLPLVGALFILALRGLSSPVTSRTGNRNGMIGMTLAIATTLWVTHVVDALTVEVGERADCDCRKSGR